MDVRTKQLRIVRVTSGAASNFTKIRSKMSSDVASRSVVKLAVNASFGLGRVIAPRQNTPGTLRDGCGIDKILKVGRGHLLKLEAFHRDRIDHT